MNIDDSMIFPNPADDQFFVETPYASGQMEIYVYDMAGRNCLSAVRSVNNTITTIHGVDDLPEGMYVVEYSTREARYRSLLQVVH